MSDDSFFREVNEEIRQEQAKALWNRYGTYMLALAVVVVLATAGFMAYKYWTETRANRSGDAFSHALTLADEGRNDEALAALRQLEEEGYGAYPLLARMRAATVLAANGDAQGAVASFDAVAADTSIPGVIRDMASLRAALILVDTGSHADVSARAEALTGDTNPLRHSAREAIGLAAWKEGRFVDALKLFEQISADEEAPRNNRERANLLAELIRGQGTAS